MPLKSPDPLTHFRLLFHQLVHFKHKEKNPAVKTGKKKMKNGHVKRKRKKRENIVAPSASGHSD